VVAYEPQWTAYREDIMVAHRHPWDGDSGQLDWRLGPVAQAWRGQASTNDRDPKPDNLPIVDGAGHGDGQRHDGQHTYNRDDSYRHDANGVSNGYRAGRGCMPGDCGPVERTQRPWNDL